MAFQRKQPRINGGWLQLQRERHDLPVDWRPPPPDNTHPLSELLPDVMKAMGLESAYQVADLAPRWPEFVGENNARHSRPGLWENGELTIYVDHNVWLAEMKQFASRAILKRLRDAYGEEAVSRIHFRIDPGDDPS